MKAKAAVLKEFHKPLDIQEFDIQDPAEGEVIVKITAAGVCGSDVHMWEGRDPRTPLPSIPGHEGVGVVAKTGGKKIDVYGVELKEGDPIMWERGIMCGKCYYCVIKKRPALCPHRKTYGLSVGCSEPPYLQGCYAEYLHLRAGAHIIKLESNIDHAALVPASCSGATAAHAVELCDIDPGDMVVIQGPGPVGLFCLAFALERGAGEAIVIGTAEDKGRLELCREFGAADTLVIDDTTAKQRKEFVLEKSRGRGADAVMDCTGSPKATAEGISLTAPYGTYSMPGVATPVGKVPIAIFEDIARKNVRVQGVWVSDTAHLLRSVKLVESGRYPFEKIVTHTFPLEQATTALEKMRSREAMKAALLP